MGPFPKKSVSKSHIITGFAIVNALLSSLHIDTVVSSTYKALYKPTFSATDTVSYQITNQPIIDSSYTRKAINTNNAGDTKELSNDIESTNGDKNFIKVLIHNAFSFVTIENFIAALIYGALAWIAFWIWNVIVWNALHSKSGWWIYGFIVSQDYDSHEPNKLTDLETDQPHTLIAGIFHLKNNLMRTYVCESHVDYYNFSENKLSPRGKFSSNFVGFGENDDIVIVYDMDATEYHVQAGIAPKYKGYMELTESSYGAKFGSKAYSGSIIQLPLAGDHKQNFKGIIYAEKLKGYDGLSKRHAESALELNVPVIFNEIYHSLYFSIPNQDLKSQRKSYVERFIVGARKEKIMKRILDFVLGSKKESNWDI